MNANLLTDAILTIEDATGVRSKCSLPSLLAALGARDVNWLSRVQPHQADIVHIFLCQLAALALHKAASSSIEQDEAGWRALLLALTDGDAAPWQLVQDDPSVAAFLQPPMPSKLAAGLKLKAATPDELDVLQTAKNHDLKQARMRTAECEDWVYALICVQTSSGFLGQGNYGICRMNGGFASRVCVSCNSSMNPGVRWAEDVSRILQRLPALVVDPWPYVSDGHTLLWRLPWDGASNLLMDELHPCFIEVCRVVRITSRAGVLRAFGHPASVARIAARETKGNVGDFWTPVDRSRRVGFTPPSTGLSATLLRELVVAQEKFEPAPLQQLEGLSGPAWFRASVLIRGQGTTEGFHEENIYIGEKAKQTLLAGGAGRERLARMSQWALERASDARGKVLRPTLFVLLDGGDEAAARGGAREAADWMRAWLESFESGWSSEYFSWLWSSIDLDDETARDIWLQMLRARATAALEHAIKAAPKRSGRRFRALTSATSMFQQRWNRYLKEDARHVA